MSATTPRGPDPATLGPREEKTEDRDERDMSRVSVEPLRPGEVNDRRGVQAADHRRCEELRGPDDGWRYGDAVARNG